MNTQPSTGQKPLVSVITPCYNGAHFMAQWAGSLAAQTYPAVEIIFVNDGSTDNSEETFNKESAALRERGYEVRYISKPNGGAADAVNVALKTIRGEYLMLFDMDDILFPEAIAAKADFLTANPGYDLVRNNGYMVRENNISDESLPFFKKGKPVSDGDMFESALRMWLLPYPGSYMARTSALFARLKDKNIYVSPYGQNLQILLPVSCFGKTGYIETPLMRYISYKTSHSHTQSFDRRLELYNGYEGNVIGILSMLDLPGEKKRDYFDIVYDANYEGRLLIGIQYRKRPLIKEQYSLMKKRGLVTPRITFLYAVSYLPFGCFAIKSYPRFIRVSKRILFRLFGKMR